MTKYHKKPEIYLSYFGGWEIQNQGVRQFSESSFPGLHMSASPLCLQVMDEGQKGKGGKKSRRKRKKRGIFFLQGHQAYWVSIG